MMMILIKEDGSTSITADGYSAWYDKEGKIEMSIGKNAPQKICIYNESKQKAEQKQVTISAEGFKVFNVAAGVTYINSPLIIDSVKINKAQADHIRQIVREEMRRFVQRESEVVQEFPDTFLACSHCFSYSTGEIPPLKLWGRV
ncbi:hypothetical protein [Xenorhabdus lircayensis]|uniref:hypothetical protein n=1 Tax=Xenorhabdus lircayensis TaxID=2763499 RepID=UPI001E6382AC|nr:hypothetical protein [Xenorhabdus lircayensis]